MNQNRPERLRRRTGGQGRTRTAGQLCALVPPTCPAPILVPPVNAVSPRDHLVAPPRGENSDVFTGIARMGDGTGGDVRGGGSARTPPTLTRRQTRQTHHNTYIQGVMGPGGWETTTDRRQHLVQSGRNHDCTRCPPGYYNTPVSVSSAAHGGYTRQGSEGRLGGDPATPDACASGAAGPNRDISLDTAHEARCHG